MKFKYLDQFFLKLKSYFFRPKYYGANIIFERGGENLNSFLKAEKTIYYRYLFSGLKKVSLRENPDFLVPFKIKKNKKYYLLIVYYASIKNSHVIEKLKHIIELFDKKENAESAIDYIKGVIRPTQHDILKMAENQDLNEKLYLENRSFSIDSRGELTLIENTKWCSGQIGVSFFIQEIEPL